MFVMRGQLADDLLALEIVGAALQTPAVHGEGDDGLPEGLQEYHQGLGCTVDAHCRGSGVTFVQPITH